MSFLPFFCSLRFFTDFSSFSPSSAVVKQSPVPATTAAEPTASQLVLLQESNKRAMDDWFRRLERRLADVESQMGVVVDLLRDIRARPNFAAAAQHHTLRDSADVHDTLVPDEELLDGADDANSDYSRPFHESRGAIEREALTTPPPMLPSSLGGTKSGLSSWQNYVSKVGEFSPTLARMAHDFELQQLQTPARRRFDAVRLPDTPSQPFMVANRRPAKSFDEDDDDDDDDEDHDDDSHDGTTKAVVQSIPRKASIYDSFLPSDADLELW